MLNIAELDSKIISLEMQIKMLHAELTKVLMLQVPQPMLSFAALEGIWSGQGDFGMDEIQKAELRAPADL